VLTGVRTLLTTSTLFLLALTGCSKMDDRPREHPAALPAASAASARSRPVRHVRATGQLGPGQGVILLDLKAPEGSKLNAGSPLAIEARGQHLHFGPRQSGPLDPAELPVRLPVRVEDGALGPAEIDVSYYYCSNDGASCRPERVTLVVDLDLSGPAEGGEAHLVHRPASG